MTKGSGQHSFAAQALVLIIHKKVQSAMMTELDYGIGNVTAALKASGQWDNTLIVVTSDNGGPLGMCGVKRAGVSTL